MSGWTVATIEPSVSFGRDKFKKHIREGWSQHHIDMLPKIDGGIPLFTGGRNARNHTLEILASYMKDINRVSIVLANDTSDCVNVGELYESTICPDGNRWLHLIDIRGEDEFGKKGKEITEEWKKEYDFNPITGLRWDAREYLSGYRDRKYRIVDGE